MMIMIIQQFHHALSDESESLLSDVRLRVVVSGGTRILRAHADTWRREVSAYPYWSARSIRRRIPAEYEM